MVALWNDPTVQWGGPGAVLWDGTGASVSTTDVDFKQATIHTDTRADLRQVSAAVVSQDSRARWRD
jgi:hypothetical protein